MTRTEKMLAIIEVIKVRPEFCRQHITPIAFRNTTIGFYYDGDEYFRLEYKGCQVNIHGEVLVNTKSLDTMEKNT
jgi:hypothetical protein